MCSEFSQSSSLLIDFCMRTSWSRCAGHVQLFPFQTVHIPAATKTVSPLHRNAPPSVEPGSNQSSQTNGLLAQHFGSSSGSGDHLDVAFRIRPEVLSKFCAPLLPKPQARIWRPIAFNAEPVSPKPEPVPESEPVACSSRGSTSFDLVAQNSINQESPRTRKSVTTTMENQGSLMRKRHCCPHCSFTCANSTQLGGHLRSHTGEKPYACDAENCHKKFARKEELTRHIKIHTGERPYVCNTCDKRFGRKDHLNKHLNIHTYRYADPLLRQKLNALFARQ